MQYEAPRPATGSIDWHRFAEMVRGHERFLLTSHVKPDCDALGSELGLAGVLEALGKQALIVNADATPPHLRFIDPQQRLRALADVPRFELDACDALVVLDTSAWGQLGAMAEVVRAPRAARLVLDHHVSADDLGAVEFKDTASPATGCLVAEAALALGVALTPHMAQPLFAAVATDTGWFRFPSTTGETLRIAGRLLDAGARPAAIYNALYERHTLGRIRLMGRVLARVETELDGRLIYTVALREDFDAAGALPSDTEDLVNATLAVGGTEVAVFFSEQPDGPFKVSFRSRSERVDCTTLAEQFGGGGHRAAAGATVRGSWREVRDGVLDAVRQSMR
jgi:phosphoesterase RecJ-like protein